MKTFSYRFVTMTIVVATLACGDATGVDPEDLEGTWNATVAVLTNPANTAQTADLIALGISITFELRSDGSLTATFDDGIEPSIEMGSLTVVGNQATLRLEGDLLVGTISRKNDLMMLTLINGADWDFGDDGVEVPATLRIELQRVN